MISGYPGRGSLFIRVSELGLGSGLWLFFVSAPEGFTRLLNSSRAAFTVARRECSSVAGGNNNNNNDKNDNDHETNNHGRN